MISIRSTLSTTYINTCTCRSDLTRGPPHLAHVAAALKPIRLGVNHLSSNLDNDLNNMPLSIHLILLTPLLTLSPISVALWFVLFSSIAIADRENDFRSEKYAHGFEGPFPLQHYSSAGLSGPILNYWEKSVACDDGLYTFIAPRGEAVRHSGPMILDNQGHLVWFKEYKTTYNANVYTYKGQRYLTFWAGDDQVRGHGEGTLYMVSFRTMSTEKNFPGQD